MLGGPVHRAAASVFGVPRRVISGFEVRSVLRTGRIFDTPPLKGLTFASEGLQSLAYWKRGHYEMVRLQPLAGACVR